MDELLALLPGVSDVLKVPVIMLVTALSIAVIVIPLRVLWKLLRKGCQALSHKNKT